MPIWKTLQSAATTPGGPPWFIPLLLLADAILSAAVVEKIPYTNIDWTTYMQQVARYLAGERDYVKITGDTGPLVYPAAHVYVYRGLHALTDGGRDVRGAQWVFVGLYVAALGAALLCYRRAGAPPAVMALLVLSKRMHSVFVLRLFNDGVAVCALFLAVYCYQRRWWMLGSLAYSAGLGVKMSLLLALPGVGVVLWQGVGRDRALTQAMIMAQVQVLLGYPFLAANPRGYMVRAFDFSRQFLFRWTVNWRFVGERVFLSQTFAVGLLAVHAGLILVFLSTRWLSKPLAQVVRDLVRPPPPQEQARLVRQVTPDYVLTVILTSTIIGCLCARSLHYQFFAYIAWSTPFLLWKGRVSLIPMLIMWAGQEWAWNVYPVTKHSSGLVVWSLAAQLLCVWIGTSDVEMDKAHSE